MTYGTMHCIFAYYICLLNVLHCICEICLYVLNFGSRLTFVLYVPKASMSVMPDGMYSVVKFLEGGDWTTRLRTIFRTCFARCLFMLSFYDFCMHGLFYMFLLF